MKKSTPPADKNSRAFWTVAPGCGELRSGAVPAPEADEVRVRARYGGISRGSEALVFHGRVPESEYERMRAPFQRGDFPFPVAYGYACVGEVEDGPGAWIGRTVFCLHPHQERFVVPTDAVVAVPDAVPAGRAVLAANAETALNALWDAGADPGDRIAVVGGGVVGLLIAWLAARLPGAEVTVVDVRPERREPAETLGARFATPDSAPNGCDLVFHCSGRAAGLQTALDAAGFEATVIEVSWYGDRAVELRLGGGFHANRLQIRASQVGHVAPAHRPRISRSQRLQRAIELLDDDRLDVLIDDESAFEDLPSRMPDVLADGAGGLCHRVVYADP